MPLVRPDPRGRGLRPRFSPTPDRAVGDISGSRWLCSRTEHHVSYFRRSRSLPASGRCSRSTVPTHAQAIEILSAEALRKVVRQHVFAAYPLNERETRGVVDR